MRAIVLNLIIICLPLLLNAQSYTRIKADFSVKTKIKDKEEARLVMGTCYYDMQVGRMVYEVKFPVQQIWIFTDSLQLIVQNDSLIESLPGSMRPELSVFHLSMKQELSHFGLKNSAFNAAEVKVDKGMVITIWEPPSKAKNIGKLATSVKDKQLEGVVFYHPKGHILRKQFFRKYASFGGLRIPTEIVDISYEADREVWQQTTYSKIIINEQANLGMYHYKPLHGTIR